MTLLLAILMAFAAVGILCYEAGADAGKRAQWHADQVRHELDLVAAQQRHPSSRRAA